MSPPPFPYAGYYEEVFRRVRVLFGGAYVVDSPRPKLVWEHPYYPLYYFPAADLPTEYLANGQPSSDGDSEIFDLVAGGKKARRSVTRFTGGAFAGHVKVSWPAADAWFEEDEQVYVHPRDPYKRIQILPSSKHVRVEVDGVEVANTTRSLRLYETSLPIRTYIPLSDVRAELLAPATLVTSCPYKGDANYYDINLPSGKTRSGLVWWYKTPTLESLPIAGRLAFYDEKVDVWVDGEKQERPQTKFS